MRTLIKRTTIIIAITAAALLAGAGLTYAIVKNNTAHPDETDTAQQTDMEATAANAVAYVRVTADGFEPHVLTITPGTEVVWTNNSDRPIQVASNPYPDHTDLPALVADAAALPGSTYTFTGFDSIGTFGYHDLLDPTVSGQIIVEEAK